MGETQNPNQTTLQASPGSSNWGRTYQTHTETPLLPNISRAISFSPYLHNVDTGAAEAAVMPRRQHQHKTHVKDPGEHKAPHPPLSVPPW